MPILTCFFPPHNRTHCKRFRLDWKYLSVFMKGFQVEHIYTIFFSTGRNETVEWGFACKLCGKYMGKRNAEKILLLLTKTEIKTVLHFQPQFSLNSKFLYQNSRIFLIAKYSSFHRMWDSSQRSNVKIVRIGICSVCFSFQFVWSKNEAIFRTDVCLCVYENAATDGPIQYSTNFENSLKMNKCVEYWLGYCFFCRSVRLVHLVVLFAHITIA